MTAVLILVAGLVAARFALTAYEARCLARIPAEDPGPRLLPVYHLAPMPDEAFVAEVDRLGLREPLLDMAREHDAGLRVPDAFLELPRRGGAR